MSLAGFTCFSGNAIGSDRIWAANTRKYGGTVVNYEANDMDIIDRSLKLLAERSYVAAANALGRPLQSKDTYVGKLLRRNYLQIHETEGVFAVGTVLDPGEKTSKGYVNRCQHESVDGGTGYAVQMAIDKELSVYVYDQERECWLKWSYKRSRFVVVTSASPDLTCKFTGIGTRQILPVGEKAIAQVCRMTSIATNYG